MLVTMRELLLKAKDGYYAIAAPNVYDQHTLLACLSAAEEEKSPIIIDWGERDGDIFTFAKVAIPLVQSSSVPAAINLDHGGSFEIAVKAIRAGFTSVMLDKSNLPFNENVKQVKEITRIAHIVGVTVEAELGHLIERNQETTDDTLNLTDPDEAKDFVDQTGVDCLAVAIGTVHGLYKGKPLLDFNRLNRIREKINIPLVLHGGSNNSDEDLRKTIDGGICKINLATDLFNAGMVSMKAHIEDPKSNLVSASMAAAAGFKKELIKYIRVFGSSNKAL